MRLLLDNEDFADQIIPDLARWEDWSVLGRLAEMFRSADEKSYVRAPVVTYLTVASEQPGSVGEEAKTTLAELERLDPKAVEQARNLMAFGALARARGTTAAPAASDAEASSAAVQTDSDANSGFGASAADVASASSIDASAIPDPSNFNKASSLNSETAEPLPSTEKPSLTSDEAAKVVAHKPLVAAVPAVTTYSRPLVIGVPLAAAGLLTIAYWLILRWGGV
jgi:hypothetical protein